MVVHIGISLINTRNSMEANIDPCGTPDSTGLELEGTPSTATFSGQLFK